MSITLYQHPLSGHSHRVRALLSILGLQANIVDVDLMSGAHKKADFLAKNAFGQVPVLEDGETTVPDSNAILVYLAQHYDDSDRWYPIDTVQRAEVQKFLSVAAGQLASGPAAARLVNVFGASLDHARAIEISHSLLTVLDQHLDERDWLVGEWPTIADIANYAYIAHAPEGDVDVAGYPHVSSWLERVERIPGFVPMQASAAGLVS